LNLGNAFKLSGREKQLVAEGLKTALGFEKKAFEFYSRKGKKAGHAEIKEIFEFLATQEKQHIRILETERKKLAEKDIWIKESLNKSKSAKPKVYSKKDSKSLLEMSKADLTIVLWAMRIEKKFEDFYRELARKSKTKPVKKFFKQLAEFKLGHYQLLDGLFETMSSTDDIIWN